jgi:alcohol dehydrogenase (cytochrome c)
MVIFRNRFALALIAIAGSTVAEHAVCGRPAAGRRRQSLHRGTGDGRRNGVSGHLRHLSSAGFAGQGTATPLAGPAFIGAWGSRPASDLLSFIQLTMPPGNPGTLTADVYASIAAFILRSNGARAGNQPLSASSQVLINTVATGQAPAAAAGRGAAPAGGQQAAGQGRGGPPAAPAGITIAGEVKNYVPVTDAMLRNPDPGDWLVIRRDYRASNYSPLNQITRENVKNLHLVWSWAMSEGGTNQPAPLVHNGVIYLNNPGNIIQALDGKTGDVIWENRYGTSPAAAAMRGIAIYEDKIFAATSDAHLLAFDARTGKTVWETVIGDRTKGTYTTSSGPLVAKGKVIQGLGDCQTYRDEKPSARMMRHGQVSWRFNTVAKAASRRD